MRTPNKIRLMCQSNSAHRRVVDRSLPAAAVELLGTRPTNEGGVFGSSVRESSVLVLTSPFVLWSGLLQSLHHQLFLFLRALQVRKPRGKSGEACPCD